MLLERRQLHPIYYCYLTSSIELTGWISAWPCSRRSNKYVPVTRICWPTWGTLKNGPLNPLHSPLLKGSTSYDVSGCWQIISDQIPPFITGLKLAFVTIFLYTGSKANGKSVSPSGCGFIDMTVPVTVTHWFNILNRPGGFAMKFHN